MRYVQDINIKEFEETMILTVLHSIVLIALQLESTQCFQGVSPQTRTRWPISRVQTLSFVKSPTGARTQSPSFVSFARQLRRLSASQSSDFSTASYDEVCDVLVLGSGVAARSIASLLAAQDLSVILSDQAFDRPFVPNYGVWKDEWAAVCDRFYEMGVTLSGGSVGNAIDREWQVTDCYFGGSFDIPTETRMRLDRPYCRVDKDALLQTLTTKNYKTLYANHASRAIGVNLYEPAGSLMHDSTGSTIRLVKEDGTEVTVRSTLIVDCTGHETKLVLRETRDPYLSPGFQIAYGVLVDVEEENSESLDIGPYAKDAMTLFDYRTDHFDASDDKTQQKVASAPTFMYGTFSRIRDQRANPLLFLTTKQPCLSRTIRSSSKKHH